MNGENEKGQEKPNLSSKPWYQRKWIWIVSVLLVMVVSAYQYIHYHLYRPIEVTYEPWQVLDPGKPVEPLKFEVVQEGGGPVVEAGDLVQLTLQWRSASERIGILTKTGGFGSDSGWRMKLLFIP
jgi:hypothetical protein